MFLSERLSLICLSQAGMHIYSRAAAKGKRIQVDVS